MAMKALFLNSKLKKSPQVLSTQTHVDRPAAVYVPVKAIFVRLMGLFSIAKKIIERHMRYMEGCPDTRQYPFYGKAGGNIATEIEFFIPDTCYMGYNLAFFSKLFKEGSLLGKLKKFAKKTMKVSG